MANLQSEDMEPFFYMTEFLIGTCNYAVGKPAVVNPLYSSTRRTPAT